MQFYETGFGKYLNMESKKPIFIKNRLLKFLSDIAIAIPGQTHLNLKFKDAGAASGALCTVGAIAL